MGTLKKYKYELALSLVVIVAAVLRFYKLDAQSLWHDELFTLNQADPELPWSETFRLLSLDSHPPLYVVISKLMYQLLGYTPWVARCTAAVAGVVTVPLMYLFGKYLADKRLGLMAAMVACVATFSILYSQEGRDYSMLMLFSALSAYFFIKLSTQLTPKTIVGYVTASVLLIYTHYFGFLVLGAEGLVVLYLLLVDRPRRKKVLSLFLLSFLAIGVLYLPWLPSMFKVSEMPAVLSEHMAMPSITFPLHHYYDFFGARPYMLPFLLGLPLLFITHVIKRRRIFSAPFQSKAALFFTLFVSCWLTGNGIPYIVSVLGRPVITPRYMIFLLPFYILLLAWGAWLIRREMLGYIVVLTFVTISLYDIIFVRKFYTSLFREQVREATAFVVEKGAHYPMINEWMAWRQKYYLEKYNYSGKILNYDGSIWPTKHNKEWMVDSILMRSPGYDIDTFWLLVINEDQPLSEVKRRHLDTAFVSLQEQHFLSGHVWLFGRKR